MAKIINMQEMQQRASGPSGGRKQKVRFIISREFVGHQTMEDAFSHLIERRTEDHYQRWREEQEAALQSGQETLLKFLIRDPSLMLTHMCSGCAGVTVQKKRLCLMQSLLQERSSAWMQQGASERRLRQAETAF